MLDKKWSNVDFQIKSCHCLELQWRQLSTEEKILHLQMLVWMTTGKMYLLNISIITWLKAILRTTEATVLLCLGGQATCWETSTFESKKSMWIGSFELFWVLFEFFPKLHVDIKAIQYSKWNHIPSCYYTDEFIMCPDIKLQSRHPSYSFSALSIKHS